MDLESDHWMLTGYCDNAKFGCGCRVVYLQNCVGSELTIYDCFGEKIRLRGGSFKIREVQARNVTFKHNYNDAGWLYVTTPNGIVNICPWEKFDHSYGKPTWDVLLPKDRNFQLLLPPPKALLRGLV